MDITVYLPNDLGQQAKDAGINFSAELRAAVIRKLELMDTIATLQEGLEPIEITVEDRDGNFRTYGFTGRWITETRENGANAAITAKGKIIVVNTHRGQDVGYVVYDDLDQLVAANEEHYPEFVQEVSEALNRPYVIELDI